MVKLEKPQSVQSIKNSSEDFILVGVICVSFFMMYALNKPAPQTIVINQPQPAPVQVPIQDKAALPATTKTNSDETVAVPGIPLLNLKLTEELMDSSPVKKYTAGTPNYLPQPLARQGLVDYKKLVAQVEKPLSRKNNPVLLLEENSDKVQEEKDDGTGVHVTLRNTQNLTTNTALPASSAMQPKVETQDADVSKFSKNNLAPSATTLTPARNESPEYKIVQEDKEGVLIRQGNKVSLIRSGEKLPDGNKAGQK